MTTSQHTFDQIKSILLKLDRRIDDVRRRRLDDSGEHPAVNPASPLRSAAPAQHAAPPARPGANTDPESTPNPGGKSGYGKARPLPRRD